MGGGAFWEVFFGGAFWGAGFLGVWAFGRCWEGFGIDTPIQDRLLYFFGFGAFFFPFSFWVGGGGWDGLFLGVWGVFFLGWPTGSYDIMSLGWVEGGNGRGGRPPERSRPRRGRMDRDFEREGGAGER